MKNWNDDYHLLGLGGFTSLIKSINVSLWGNEITFQCLYNPEEPIPYQIIFKDCQEIRWDVYDSELANELQADLFGISLGEDHHRKPALITTDIFEISILYDQFILEKSEINHLKVEEKETLGLKILT
ncbi:conserved hypothetical protein [Planktothrix serta PCC 8927]|uniref:Uncharacterized protein n=1 Tax=Planktothrix serta PCC 8927 TaxID=671068 RepID=A0A7Z9DXY9_9CYAN|nr:hypothetical protein [Planktothrix serta]VXD15229.1 conserved hypothetical protein [Planktothrix serta PCC 8927]